MSVLDKVRRWIDGETAELVASSTDANVPIALGIPAIAVGAGGESGGTHTTDEWFTNEMIRVGVWRIELNCHSAGVDFV